MKKQMLAFLSLILVSSPLLAVEECTVLQAQTVAIEYLKSKSVREGKPMLANIKVGSFYRGTGSSQLVPYTATIAQKPQVGVISIDAECKMEIFQEIFHSELKASEKIAEETKVINRVVSVDGVYADIESQLSEVKVVTNEGAPTAITPGLFITAANRSKTFCDVISHQRANRIRGLGNEPGTLYVKAVAGDATCQIYYRETDYVSVLIGRDDKLKVKKIFLSGAYGHPVKDE